MAKSPKDQRQPRAITPDLAIQPYFRGSMYAELQKFQDKGRVQQLMFGEDVQNQDNMIEAYGLDLTVSEDRALHAIQILLDSTDYKGNIPGETVTSEAYQYQGLIPRLSITYSEYFQAYGLDRKDGQYYKGRQAEEALKALESLAETRKICYVRRRWTGKSKSKKVYDVIRVTKPLLSFIEGFQDLEEEEAAQVLDGKDLPEKRQTKLVIEVSPLLVDSIETFYLLKPSTLHTEIKEILGSRRISRSVSLFIEWLLTKNTKKVKISKERLAERLRLDYYVEHRHWSRLDKTLQEAFQTALELEYLLDYKEETTGLIVFTLNPDRCQRIGLGEPEEEEL